MKRIVALLGALAIVCMSLFALATPAQATGGNTIVKYGTTFTYNGAGSWTVKNTDNSKALKNLGNPQSVLCTNYDTGLNKPCTDGASYTTNGNDVNGKNCVYIQGDGGAHGSWDTVPGDSTKSVCSDEPDHPADGKAVTLCTYDNNGVGVRKTVSILEWYTNYRGTNTNIWEAFTYLNKDGDTISVDAHGDTALLAFADCKYPKQDEKVVASYTSFDKCGTAKDSVTVSHGTGYTGDVAKNGLVYTVTADTASGFIFDAAQMTGWTLSAANTHAQATVTLTDEDCGLPNTGGEAQYNTTLGFMALGGLAVLGGALVLTMVTRKRS